MGTELAKSEPNSIVAPPADVIEKLVAENDLSKLTPPQRLRYYTWRCHSIGVDPAAQPFEYLTLDKKLVLYPKAYLADQLRAVHKISVKMGASKLEHGVYTIVATASAADGRVAENIGAVAVLYPEKRKVWEDGRSFWEPHPQAGKQFVGLDLANAIKKATTQAQRRATFSLVGLGGQDTDDVEGVQRLDVNAMHDPKGLLPTDNAVEPEVVEPQQSDEPIEWSTPDKWPAGNPDTVTFKMPNPTVGQAKNGAPFATVTVDDGFGEVKFGTFHATGIAALNRLVGKVCEAQIIDTGKPFKLLLTIKEAHK